MDLVITPLVVIETEMEQILTSTSTKFLNLRKTSASTLKELIEREKPSVLLTNIKTQEMEDVQDALLSVLLAYIAVDEVQVKIVSHNYLFLNFHGELYLTF